MCAVQFFWSFESIKTTISDFSLKRYVFNLDADESVRNIDPCLLSEEYLNKKKKCISKSKINVLMEKGCIDKEKKKEKEVMLL